MHQEKAQGVREADSVGSEKVKSRAFPTVLIKGWRKRSENIYKEKRCFVCVCELRVWVYLTIEKSAIIGVKMVFSIFFRRRI